MAVPVTADPVHHLDPAAPFRYGTSWDWRKPRRGEFFRTCSYCGSIHPEDLAPELTGGGAVPHWADMKYGWPHKFYVEGLKPRNPAMLHCTGHSTSERGSWGHDSSWIAAADLTRGQKRIINADGMHIRGEKFTGWYLLQPRTSLHAKFYTVHLADPGIADEVKGKIYAACGLRLHFGSDGRISWHGAANPCGEVHPS